MNKKALIAFSAFFCAFFPPLCALERSGVLDPAWSKVLSADVTLGPKAARNRLFCVTSDNTLHCLSDSGAFLWSKPLKYGQAELLTVTEEGFIYTVSGTGYVSAFSTDGLFLWALSGRRPPVFSPISGRDGRLFLVYSDSITCVSASGARKWSRVLPVPPAFPPVEDGNGTLLVPAREDILFRMSPFGELLETLRIEPLLSALAAAPDGFVCSFASGLIMRVSTGRPGGTVWTATLDSPCTAVAEADGTVYAFCSDGLLVALNTTDGTVLWSQKTGLSGTPATVRIEEDSVYLWNSDRVVSIARNGSSEFSYILFAPVRNPVLMSGDRLFGSGPDWFLYAYRIQTRITGTKNTRHKAQNYGILNGTVPEALYLNPDPYREQLSFLARVAESIQSGTAGASEVYYARRLAAIVGDRNSHAITQGRAAALLGQLGSFEYRPVLASGTDSVQDSSAMIGLLYGIAAIGYDPDGELLDAVHSISRKAGPEEFAVQIAVCDALYAIVRYTSGRSAETAGFLARFAASPYPESVRKHAIALLANILN